MKEKISQLKKEKNAIILSHYYTRPEVQEVADFVGDSLALARAAVQTNADIILFAGVHFMAETAKILNPTKKVIIPDLNASCSLADSCAGEAFAEFLKQYPQHTVLSYVNCSARVKALSDIIVTSGNALKIVSALPADTPIVFAPDRNLGDYINRKLGRKMVLWDGACHVHNTITAEAVKAARKAHPTAYVLAHPECPREALAEADFVGSTAAMLTEVQRQSCREFIVVTEPGILFELQRQNPEKIFYPLLPNSDGCCCEYMKINTLENIYRALSTEQPELLLPDSLMNAARKSIDRMLEF